MKRRTADGRRQRRRERDRLRRHPSRSSPGTAAAMVAMIACAPVPRPAPLPAPMPPEAPAPVPLPATMPSEGVIAGPAGALRYRIMGTAADTTIVTLGIWLADSLAPLAGRHTLVFYDPRHRGGSHALVDSAQATFQGDLADLEAVRAAFHLSRLSLIGYDYYAGVVAAWAGANPSRVARVILLSPIEPADSLARGWNPLEQATRLDTTAARSLVKWRAAGRDTTDPVAYCQAFWRVNAPLFLHDTTRAARLEPHWCAWPNEAPPRIAAAAGPALSSLGPAADFGAQAQGVTAPVLVIHGRNDLVANPDGAREWARRFPEARLLWLRGTGHAPHIESASLLRNAIEFFLSGHWPPLAEPPK